MFVVHEVQDFQVNYALNLLLIIKSASSNDRIGKTYSPVLELARKASTEERNNAESNQRIINDVNFCKQLIIAHGRRICANEDDEWLKGFLLCERKSATAIRGCCLSCLFRITCILWIIR